MCSDEWLEFLYDQSDCFFVFELVLHDDAEEFGIFVLFEDGVIDVQLELLFCVSGEEYCVIGFGWIWNKVVGVEVVDEVVEF